MGELKIKVGDTHTFSKQVSNEDVLAFAEVSGDKNPLHLDDEYASKTMFKERIAHGMIGAGVISAAIGMGMQLASVLNIDPGAYHRIASIASGGLDSLPHCGAVITLLAVTGMNHKKSYADIGMVTVVIPCIATVAVVILGMMGVV